MFEDLCIVLAVMLTLCVAEPRVEEVVYPRILEARGPNGKKMVYIRDGLTLSLEKSKVFSENFTFTEGDSTNYTNKAINVNDIEDSLYQDNKHGSSVVLKESNGSVEIRGILTDELSIEPALSRPRSKEGMVGHAIKTFNKTSIPLFADYVKYRSIAKRKFEGMFGGALSDSNSVTRPHSPFLDDTILVETRIIYDHYLSQHKGKDSLTKYFAILMNKVNQVYMELSNPRPQFMIVGITRSTKESPLRIAPGGFLDVCYALEPLKDFVQRSGLTNAQDVLIFVSGLPSNPALKKQGCTRTCGICSPDGVTVQTIRDMSDQSSAVIIAHELGHQLGMGHEGDRAEFYTPGNADLYCGHDSGRLMQAVAYSKGRSVFSHCVYDQMKGCLMQKDEMCFAQTAGRLLL